MKRILTIVALLVLYYPVCSQCIVGNCEDGYGEYRADSYKYEGNYSNGRKNGKGTYTWKSGQKYTGEWKDDLFHGYGVLQLASGNSYEGDFKYDKKNGLGTEYGTEGKVLFAGQFIDGNKVPMSSTLSSDILADKYLLEAKKLMEERSFKAAIVSFNKILALQVSPPQVFYYYLGKCHHNASNYSHAIRHLTKYLSLAGKNGEYYTNSLELLSQSESKVNTEAQLFTEKKLEVKNCSVCYGTGFYDKDVTCNTCSGKRKLFEYCSLCGGNGQSSFRCTNCGGSGSVGYQNNGQWSFYDCSYCINGWLNCSKCSGKTGYLVSCDNCNGWGKVKEKTKCYKH